MLETATLPELAGRPRRRPRLGFIGLGWIGRLRLESIARSEIAEIAAVFDPQRDAAVKAVALARDATIAQSTEELFERDLDGVVIATPNALHAPLTMAALRRGKAVFCQKPLARNLAETEGVIALAREMDRLLHVDLSYRFTAGMQRIHELIGEGTLGRIYAVEAVFHNAFGPDKKWFYDPAQSGGGCLLDLGIHLVDLILWCLAFPEVGNVASHLLHHGAPMQPGGSEDYAAAQFFLASGVSVQLACSWRVPAGCDAKIALTFYGTSGGASFTNVGGSFFDFIAEHLLPDRSRRLLAGPPDDWGGGAAMAWARRLGESPRFDPEIEHLSAVADVLDRIYGRLP